jgi:hypothetical protein
MSNTPAVIFATASVGFLASAIWADTVNSFLIWISPEFYDIRVLSFWS